MTSFVVVHTNQLPPCGQIFYVLPVAITGLAESHKHQVDNLVPVVRVFKTGLGVERRQVTYCVCTSTDPDGFSYPVNDVNMAYWFMPKDHGYDLYIMNKRADGMPVCEDERMLRRLLCNAHDSMAYMDDGEAQSSTGLDYMRTDVKELCTQFMAAKHEVLTKQLKQLAAEGIPYSLDSPYNPIQQITDILSKIKPGEPISQSVFDELVKVKQYLTIAHPNYGVKG